MDKEIKNMHGGRRDGAGRKKGDSRLFAFRADGSLARYIDLHDNKTRFITDCIRREQQKGSHGDATDYRMDRIENGQLPGEIVATRRIKPLHLPFFDISVVAGFPIPLDNDERAQDIELLQMLCPNPEASYLIRVTGDSMRDADIHSGDILIVDKSNRQPTEHEVAVCELNGEYTVKRVVQENGRAWLVPANPNYPRIEVTENDNFSVWGVVTYTIHKPRS